MAVPSKYVLIAEDDSFIGKVYSKKLEQEGFTVKLVSNGNEALAEIEKKKPDLLLLDLIMPLMDGFEVIEKLKSSGAIKTIKIVVLSNLGQESDVKKIKEFGIESYLVKTESTLQEVVQTVKNNLH